MSQGSSSWWGSSSVPVRLIGKFGKRTGYPLVICPFCGDEVIELLSGPGAKNPNKVYLKCCQNEQNVTGTCGFYLFADKYRRMLTNINIG
ncbi:hypothetical protein PVAP13_5KG529300 [Panicum virgatum]|uniref:Uncharacterized protein n=1 Tax=Panicum virgatum TaxID=38727 RepID=A0A8T0SLY3_PANVG|nr:hypothetical protein PVAP13_5KG529300 [Panicum virgatum]